MPKFETIKFGTIVPSDLVGMFSQRMPAAAAADPKADVIRELAKLFNKALAAKKSADESISSAIAAENATETLFATVKEALQSRTVTPADLAAHPGLQAYANKVIEKVFTPPSSLSV